MNQSWRHQVPTGTNSKKKRVVSGMRPTGRLHIGHYFGALENWVRLQNETLPDASSSSPSSDSPLATGHSSLPSYECFYFIADWHALTSDYADTSAVAQNTIEIMTDYLAVGLDPTKSVIFQQSLVPEHAELHLLLSMVTPLGWLERVPTYKEALENVKDKDLHNYGFLGYPVLQCADIVIYSEPDLAGLYVPVGEDQVSHVETSREIVRRFDGFYSWKILEQNFYKPGNDTFVRLIYNLLLRHWSDGAPEFHGTVVTRELVDWIGRAVRQASVLVGARNLIRELNQFQSFAEFVPVLVEPDHLLTPTPRIPGTDGRKMSKSYNNAIMLSESNESIWEKVRPMKTDPARIRRTDPGNPDICPVYDWHKLFSTKETLDWAAHGCRTAEIGCIDCKKKMVEHLVTWITPVRERRVQYEKKPAQVLELIDQGSQRARVEAQKTMERVREAVFHWDKKRGQVKAALDVHESHI
jgi:tryptophanyl-tRNA synthetase